MGVSGRSPLSVVAVALTAMACVAGCSGKKAADGAASTPSTSASATASTSTSADTSTSAATSSASTPSTPQAPSTEKWTALKAGDCMADAPPTDPAVVTVTLVDCATPHLAEAYLRADIPVDAALDGTANTQCETGFVEYTGGPSAGSRYTTTYLIDSDQDRTFNNPLPSTVICLLQDAQGQSLTGSAHR